jgi:hypothetical protein
MSAEAFSTARTQENALGAKANRRVSDLRQLEKNIAKAHQEAKKKLRELAAQEFACLR